MNFDPRRLGPALLALARDAGDAIMQVYASPIASRTKADHSPVTDADEAAEAIILAGLEKLTPGIPVVAEEKSARGDIPDITNSPFWLVDPLDGTREFLGRNGEFTVNIALVGEDRRLRLGIVLAPAQGDGIAWLGLGSEGAWRYRGRDDMAGEAIKARLVPDNGATVLISRSHRDAETEAWLQRQQMAVPVTVGSSLKFCRIAEGAADLYPRFVSISEWDTAAGQAVLEAAGGAVVTWDEAPLTYGKPGFRNPGFLARGAV
ncbi:3'(2'),5'-bisphosphate nucleotidase CysQ [uncultured Ferrovibrio sp.]|jgi:3'(2'), 5'-bisphosphate nucleotidase|uniref:3'(2'),5'-bisphosphate nucleotidase CysQ n=1 Tax=uncultured Ferrovibrio sp. TaxID=1576913 RepID=UPI00263431E2|nr:3'(2'),5'-bisphosphate nucleotidase CysQ [uncultured Ferrovibrio sp.]